MVVEVASGRVEMMVVVVDVVNTFFLHKFIQTPTTRDFVDYFTHNRATIPLPLQPQASTSQRSQPPRAQTTCLVLFGPR